MDTEDWKEFKWEGKRFKTDRLRHHKECIKVFCEEYGIDYNEIQDWHVRVSGNEIRCDLFPMKSSYHLLNTNQRGKYKDIGKFLDKTFKTESYGNL